jgi:hypothetical protein
MRCNEFESRLNDLLDLRRTPSADPQLLGHAAACSDCREQLAACDLLFLGLNAPSPPALSPGFARAVVAQAYPIARTRSIQPLALWGAICAIAAAVLLMVSLMVWRPAGEQRLARPAGGNAGGQFRGGLAIGFPRPAPPSPNATTQTQQPVIAAVPAQPAISPLPTPAAPSSPDQLAQAAPTPDAISDYRFSFEQFTNQLPIAVPPLETVDQYAPGFRPLRESFEAAFDALRRTIPGAHDSPSAPPQAIYPQSAGVLA